jgi:hypothetical protein
MGPEKLQKPPLRKPEPGTQCRLCGQFYRDKAPVPPTQTKTTAPYIEHCWLVMRSTGQRPRRGHTTLESAQEEACRIAALNPGAEIWQIECHTISTLRSASSPPPSGEAPAPTRRGGSTVSPPVKFLTLQAWPAAVYGESAPTIDTLRR